MNQFFFNLSSLLKRLLFLVTCGSSLRLNSVSSPSDFLSGAPAPMQLHRAASNGCDEWHACNTKATKCSSLSSNHDTTTSKGALSTLPAESGMIPWLTKYVEAWRQEDEHKRYLALKNLSKDSYFEYFQKKAHVMEAIENQMGAHMDLWQPGRSLLDIGCYRNWLGAYFETKYGMEVVGYDIPFTSQCSAILKTPVKVNFFWKDLPEPAESHDAVSFMNVLHHASNHTGGLLEQASKIARKWILITEDIESKSSHARNVQHDSKGIFRTDLQWKEMFHTHCSQFKVKADGYLRHKVKIERITVSLEADAFFGDGQDVVYKWYLLERL